MRDQVPASPPTSGEDPSQVADFSLCPRLVGGTRELSGSLV